MTKEELAKRINVTRQTIANWEKEKPELTRLIKLGLSVDNQFKNFFELFPDGFKGNSGIWTLHNFYLDFYFRFLNYFRGSITLNQNSTDINTCFILYLIKQNDLFDQEFKLSDSDLSNFERKEFMRPLSNIDRELSDYVLKNTLDDFETLVKDTFYNSDELFLDSIKISIRYLVYKYNTDKKYSEKIESIDVLEEEIGISFNQFKMYKIDKNKILKKYMTVKKEYILTNLNKISDELKLYAENSFYVPEIYRESKS